SGAGPTFGVDDMACAAATHLGCWEELGLTVEWMPALGGIKAMGKVLAGEVDAAYGGLGPVLQLRGEGEPLRILVSMARALAQNLVVPPHITSTDALRGASWAVDGINALSHHMARSIVAALPLTEDEIDWRVVGPPPERIAALLDGSVDVSLIRVEEALALTGDASNDLHMLLGFAALKDLVPLQPHGVLATTERFEASDPERLDKLVRGLVAASRRLDSDFEAFRRTFERYVTVRVTPRQIEEIWEQERRSKGFAVDGEMSAAHWDGQLDAYARLNPGLPRIAREDVLATRFVEAVLAG
ncbi:MAG: ABC transporter substrate-binding protein, partial [Pseudomonadota bacterium]